MAVLSDAANHGLIWLLVAAAGMRPGRRPSTGSPPNSTSSITARSVSTGRGRRHGRGVRHRSRAGESARGPGTRAAGSSGDLRPGPGHRRGWRAAGAIVGAAVSVGAGLALITRRWWPVRGTDEALARPL